MERLTPLADAFLEAEDADENASLAIGSLAVFEGPAPSFDEVVEAIGGRLPLIPRYRQKLRPVPLSLAAPAWVDDPDFDIHHHLTEVAVPAPGGREEVAELVSRLMSTRMDRDHPLWDYSFWTGLPEGRWALLSKVHHSVVDGVSGTDLYQLLLDPSPTQRPAVPDTWQPEPEEPMASYTVEALRELASSPLHLTGALARAARRPLRLVRTTTRNAAGLLTLSSALRPVHGTSLAGPLEGGRRYTWTTVPFEDLRAVRTAYGATINDVALAAVTGGFRRLLLARGEPTDAHARARWCRSRPASRARSRSRTTA
ncbi:wax ester/triacylglycerol synthase domain-containing protein [Nocardioides ungokensis]|uniref:wax ester/triacylglycerol synthase domain-containing protein n=1 Tax=Nocardioides ungokensis TaxID=1643322 RepID=UPI0015DDBA8D|nr:wax ester/triacylglycerol synthase domain-containing protein [Nocardioides ungokensis]